MKVQVNSDKTVAVDAALTRFVEGEVSRVLGRFATTLTRVELHLSDIDNRKTGKADKRCLIEARPMGAQPLSVSATATKIPSAVGQALGKMQRSLTTFFGRRGRTAVAAAAAFSTVGETVAENTAAAAKMETPVRKTAVKKQVRLISRAPKKKGIYQARRKAWPAASH